MALSGRQEGLTCALAPQGSLRIFEGPQESLTGPTAVHSCKSPTTDPPGLRPLVLCLWRQPVGHRPGSVLALKSLASGRGKEERHLPEASVPRGSGRSMGPWRWTQLWGPQSWMWGRRKKAPAERTRGDRATGTEPVAETLEPPGALSPSTTKKSKKKPKEFIEMVKPETGMPESKEEMVDELELRVKRESLEETILSPVKEEEEAEGARRDGAGWRDDSRVSAAGEDGATGGSHPTAVSSKKKKRKRGTKG